MAVNKELITLWKQLVSKPPGKNIETQSTAEVETRPLSQFWRQSSVGWSSH